jgi:hypothetical protein
MKNSLLERYEQVRRRCLAHGNHHPDMKINCRAALHRHHSTLEAALAELADDMALALKRENLYVCCTKCGGVGLDRATREVCTLCSGLGRRELPPEKSGALSSWNDEVEAAKKGGEAPNDPE